MVDVIKKLPTSESLLEGFTDLKKKIKLVKRMKIIL